MVGGLAPLVTVEIIQNKKRLQRPQTQIKNNHTKVCSWLKLINRNLQSKLPVKIVIHSCMLISVRFNNECLDECSFVSGLDKGSVLTVLQ